MESPTCAAALPMTNVITSSFLCRCGRSSWDHDELFRCARTVPLPRDQLDLVHLSPQHANTQTLANPARRIEACPGSFPDFCRGSKLMWAHCI